MVSDGVEGLRNTEQDIDPTEKDHVHEHANPKSSERIHNRKSEAGVATLAWPLLEMTLLKLNDFHSTCGADQGPVNST